MSEANLEAAKEKMVEAGVASAAIEVFAHYYEQLESGATGLILEETIEPYLDPPLLAAGERGIRENGHHQVERWAGHIDGVG